MKKTTMFKTLIAAFILLTASTGFAQSKNITNAAGSFEMNEIYSTIACFGEEVKVSGTVTYTIKEFLSDRKNTLTFVPDFRNVIAVGVNSGLSYKVNLDFKQRQSSNFSNGNYTWVSVNDVTLKNSDRTTAIISTQVSLNWNMNTNEVVFKNNSTTSTCN